MPLSSRLYRRQFTAGTMAAMIAAAGYHATGSSMQVGHSPFASPVAEEQSTGDHLHALTEFLAMIPLSVVNAPEGSGLQWEFADIASQFASVGLSHSSSGLDFENEPLLPALYRLALRSSVYQVALKEDFLDAIGFQPLGMNQTLFAGDPPNQVTLFRGEFSSESLVAAWSDAGYQQVKSASGSPVWTIGPEGEFDASNPVQQSVLSAMNNIAIVEDVLVCSPQLSTVNDVLTLVTNGGESALDDSATALIIPSLPDSMVSAAAARADAFQDTDMPLPPGVETTLASIQAEVGNMPPVTGLITAVAGGATTLDSDWSPDGAPIVTPRPDAGRGFFRLGTESPEDAAQAVAVVQQRWSELSSLRTQEMYADLLQLQKAFVEGNVAAFDFLQTRSPSIWLQMVISRDLLFLLPEEE